MRDTYPEVVSKLIKRSRKGGVDKIIIRSPRYHKVLMCTFHDDTFDVYFDPRTSKGGFVQRLELRGTEPDPWETLSEIMLYFLKEDDNLKKVKWKGDRLDIVI